MRLNYFLSRAAEEDIEGIIEYLAKNNLQAADTFLEEVFSAMEQLAVHPEIGHIREDLTDEDVKFWTFKWHYLIIYRSAIPIEIVRVISGHRNIPVMLC